MKNFRHLFFLVIAGNLLGFSAQSQGSYCVPTTILPFSSSFPLPGITQFKLNTIDRVSDDCENCPNNNYVFTGLSTDLEAGKAYTIEIRHTVDPIICSYMSLRVWIDYNGNFSFGDYGETVLTKNNHEAGTYVGTFTVPMDAKPGPTRLRATAKMSTTCNHTTPTPCDLPPDPGHYHGEMEDYTVNIIQNISATHTAEAGLASLSVSPNPASGYFNVQYDLEKQVPTNILLLNNLGQTVKLLQAEILQTAGH